MTKCFICEQERSLFQDLTSDVIRKDDLKFPLDGMSDQDFVCNQCYDKIDESDETKNKKSIKEILENGHWVEEGFEYEQSDRPTLPDNRPAFDLEFQELKSRTPEYKPHWNKNGVIQFKNERVAILQRAWGAQVEFIIAYDDLTAEGYRLMAIDEGKQAQSGMLTGGANAYFYFQKMDYVK